MDRFAIKYSKDAYGIVRAFFYVDGKVRHSAYDLREVMDFARGYTGRNIPAQLVR